MTSVPKTVRNIYRTPEERPVDYSRAAGPHPDVEEDIQRYQRRSFWAGANVLIVLLSLVFVIGKHLLDETKEPIPIRPSFARQYVPYHTLPAEQTWVIDYEVAGGKRLLGSDEDASFSTKWLKNAAYHVIVGQQALKLENHGKAIYHLEKALEVLPEMTGVHEPLGIAYLKLGLPQKAVLHLEHALEESNHFVLQCNLGVAHLRSGNLERAELCLCIARSQNSEHPASYKNLALLYREKGEPEKCIQQFEEYLSRNENDFEAIALLAQYLVEQDLQDQAAEFLHNQSVKFQQKILPVQLLLAEVQSTSTNAAGAVSALENIAEYLGPNLALNELNRSVFDPIRQEDVFQSLVQEVELAAVSLENSP